MYCACTHVVLEYYDGQHGTLIRQCHVHIKELLHADGQAACTVQGGGKVTYTSKNCCMPMARQKYRLGTKYATIVMRPSSCSTICVCFGWHQRKRLRMRSRTLHNAVLVLVFQYKQIVLQYKHYTLPVSILPVSILLPVSMMTRTCIRRPCGSAPST